VLVNIVSSLVISIDGTVPPAAGVSLCLLAGGG
jgi:hypothetical protein